MGCIPQSSALNLTFRFLCDELNASHFCSIFYVADTQHKIEFNNAKKKRLKSHNEVYFPFEPEFTQKQQDTS